MIRVILKTLSSSVVVLIISFIVNVLVSRMLGVEARGEYSSLLMISALISGVVQIGLPESIIYNKRRYAINILPLIILSIFILTAFTVLLYVVSSIFYTIRLSSDVYFMLLISSGFFLFFSVLSQIDESLKWFNRTRLLLPIVSFSYVVFYALLNQDISIVSLVSILIIVNVFNCTIIFINLAKNNSVKFKIKLREIQKVIRYASRIYGTSILSLFIQHIDKIYLLYIGTLSQFGIYSVAYTTSRLIGVLPQTVSTVIYSKHAGKSQSGIDDDIKIMFSCLFIPFLLLSFILCISSFFIIPLIYGVEYSKAVMPFSILVVECVISSFGWLLAQRFNSAGFPGIVFIRQLISVLPIIVIFFTGHEIEDVTVLLSSLLLLSSVMRLFITLYLYERVFKVSRPSIFPKIEMFKNLTKLIEKR